VSRKKFLLFCYWAAPEDPNDELKHQARRKQFFRNLKG